MTRLYGGLFLISGALLLLIAGVASSSVTATARAGHVRAGSGGGSAQPGGPAGQGGPPSVAHRLLIGSLVALGVMAVGSAILGWFVAGHALRPLRTITATARRISEDNLHERLAFSGPDDELKQLADTFDDLLERLEGAFAAQRQFVANASHELRTPLATMRASLDVAEAKPEPMTAQTAALASRFRAELDRIDDLLEGFLALARVQHGALPDTTVVSLRELAAGALAARSAAATRSGLTVRWDAADYSGPVEGSQALVGRMVDNIIDNAIVHNEPDGWISVSVRAAGSAARLTVQNGGAILQQSQVALLAQPFRRLGADRTGSDTGSGLGLSIVAAIAAAHGGALELHALPDGGLRAEITLPLARPIVAAAANTAGAYG